MSRVASHIRVYSRTDIVSFRRTKERFGGLSNMAPGFPLVVNGVTIRTTEALYQACRFPGLPDVQRMIIEEKSPMTAKMLSKPYRDQSRPDWLAVRVKVMRWCLRLKLAQNWKTFGELLYASGDQPIVEDSAKDDFWGAKKDEEGRLVGQNILGRLLMELREHLRSPRGSELRTVPLPGVRDFLLCGEPITYKDISDLPFPEEKTDIQLAALIPPDLESQESPRDLKSKAAPNPFEGDISNEAIQSWLLQFDEEDRSAVVTLLSGFRYYSSKKVSAMAKGLYQSLKACMGATNHNVWFVPVGYVAKSGSIIAYYFRTQNNLPQDRFVAASDLASLVTKEDEKIVFLDDYVGSGHQAIQVWKEAVSALPSLAGKRCAYAVLVGFATGLETIRESTGLEAVALETLTGKARPFSPEGALFKTESERTAAMRIAQKYGKRLYPNHPLGYAESQGLLGFFYSTPNNTLPIFWSTQGGWKPLLAHGESFRDPAFLIGPPPGLSKESASGSPRKPLIDSEELEKFDVDPELAIRAFSEFRKISIFLTIAPAIKELEIRNDVFSEILNLIRELKTFEHEREAVQSAVLIVSDRTPETVIGVKMLSTDEKVTIGSKSEILTLVQLVDGFRGAVVFNSRGRAIGNFLYQNVSNRVSPLIPEKYQRAVQTSTATAGLLILFSGDGRVAIFYKGERLLSYRSANWHLQSAMLSRGIRELSKRHSIDVPVLEEVFRLATKLSDEAKGAIMTVGHHDEVLKFSDLPKTSFLKWEEMNLGNTPDEALLGLLTQDGATLISGDGKIIQSMTFLRPPPGTLAEEEIGKGSKHSTAAKISKVTKAVCVAVSVDGRITVYSEGRIAFKLMG